MKRIVLTALLVVVVVAGIVITRLPASLISNAVMQQGSPVSATLTRGTIWRGETFLTTPDLELGTLSWTVAPLGLLTGRVNLDWRLRDAGPSLEGTASAGLSSTTASVRGRLDSATLNALLRPYDIRIDSGVDIQSADITIEGRWPSRLEGTVTWAGGNVSYRLSGQEQFQRLPPMTAILDLDTDPLGSNIGTASPQPRAQVRADGDPILMLRAALQRNGFAKVGITRHFTEMVGMPWPGSDADHAIVLEVEEQVF